MGKTKWSFKKLGNWLAFLLGFDGKIKRETVDLGLCDYSGQGRNSYGR